MSMFAFSRISDLSAVKTLAQGTLGAIPAGITSVTIQAETQAVRYRTDGIDPTSTTGLLLASGASVTIPGNGSNVRVLENTASASLNVVFRRDGGHEPPDTVVPEIVSATILATGETLRIVFSEPVKGTAGFSLSVDELPDAVTYASGEGSPTCDFDVAHTIFGGSEVLLSYTPGDIVDLSDNALAAIADMAVTNNSVQP